jgi:hypothetical protein
MLRSCKVERGHQPAACMHQVVEHAAYVQGLSAPVACILHPAPLRLSLSGLKPQRKAQHLHAPTHYLVSYTCYGDGALWVVHLLHSGARWSGHQC